MYDIFKCAVSQSNQFAVIVMYINITGSQNNKDVYIYQSYRKGNENRLLAFTKNSENTMTF